MIRLIALLSACILMLSGCGCTNDANNDGIIGNDQTADDNVMDNGNNNGSMNNDTVMDDNTVMDDEPIVNEDGFTDDNNTATDNARARSNGIVGRAVDGAGNMIEDIGRGANNVMQDVGNALR